MQFDESLSYLDLDAGQVVTVSEDLLCKAEEPGDEQPDLPEWQKDRVGDRQTDCFNRPLQAASDEV